jgi:hypothetical protein
MQPMQAVPEHPYVQVFSVYGYTHVVPLQFPEPVKSRKVVPLAQ